MKNNLLASIFALLFSATWALAQQPSLQYYRGWDKDAINTFEPSKRTEQPEYTGFKIRIGGSFTQDFQKLTSENKAFYVATSGGNSENKNFLYGSIKAEDSTSSVLSGFNLAMANLNLDMQIADGIRVCLENYMSARHHSEFWVKGGYIQIDKLPMFDNPQWFTNHVRVKIGHFQPNFGDMQFRRSDGGNTMFNPFVENGILDAFTTEIGGEVYVFPSDGFMVMAGMTSGFINGNIVKTADANNAFGVVASERSPSIFGKVAYDKSFESLRFRLSASIYNNPNSTSNTLFAGDRTGSHYFGVMEPAKINGVPISIGTSSTTQSGPNFTSGRFNPGFSNRVTAISISPFIKIKGLEIFGSYDIANGAVYGDTVRGEWQNRSFNQIMAEGVYRFLPNEQMYVGARYIKATGEPNGVRYSADDNADDPNKTSGEQAEVGIDRLAFAAGWFPSKNLLLKVEYMTQNYTDFPKRDYRYEGKVNGFMVEAVIGF
ncbi:MAG: hypothetical protein ABMA02_19525 [Saprospiraceae bacterium]